MVLGVKIKPRRRNGADLRRRFRSVSPPGPARPTSESSGIRDNDATDEPSRGDGASWGQPRREGKGKAKAVGFVDELDEAPAVDGDDGGSAEREQDGMVPYEEIEDIDRCAICLSEVQDKTIVSPCQHSQYCFACILAWSDQSRRCPLCLGPISHLLHNIRSLNDYQRYFPLPLPDDRGRGRSRAEEDDTWGRAYGAGGVRILTEDDVRRTLPPQRQTRTRPRRISNEEEEEAALERRRHIYRHGLYAKHIASNPYTRFRNVLPSHFEASPELKKKVTAFVRRELRVFPSVDIEFLVMYVVSIMGQLELKSDGAIRLIGEFLGGEDRAEHFAHELSTYVRSPYTDLRVFDSIVQYGRPEMRVPPLESPSAPPKTSAPHWGRRRSRSASSDSFEKPNKRRARTGSGRRHVDSYRPPPRRPPETHGNDATLSVSRRSLSSSSLPEHSRRLDRRSGTPPGTPPTSPGKRPDGHLQLVGAAADPQLDDNDDLLSDSDSEEPLDDTTLLKVLAEAPAGTLLDDDEDDIISLGETRSPTPPPASSIALRRASTPPAGPQTSTRVLRPSRNLLDRITTSIAAAADDASQAVRKGPRPSDFLTGRRLENESSAAVKMLAIRGKARPEEKTTDFEDLTTRPVIDTDSLASRLQARLAAEKALVQPARPPIPPFEDVKLDGSRHVFSDELRARLLARLEEEKAKKPSATPAPNGAPAESVDTTGLKSEATLKQEVLAALSARRLIRRQARARENELRLKVRLARRRRDTLDGSEALRATASVPLNPAAPEFVKRKSNSESDLKAVLQGRKSQAPERSESTGPGPTLRSAPAGGSAAAARQAELKARLTKLNGSNKSKSALVPQPSVPPPRHQASATLQERLRKEKIKAQMAELQKKLKRLEDQKRR